MEPQIEPATWDVIVVGSGLPECMIASALAKSGKSVLLVDQEDTYGSDFASLTLQSLRQAAQGAQPSLTATEGNGSQPSLAAAEAVGADAVPPACDSSSHASTLVVEPLDPTPPTGPEELHHAATLTDTNLGHSSHCTSEDLAKDAPHAPPHAAAAAWDGLLRVPLPPFRPPLHGVLHYTTSEASQHKSRAFILDLMPKFLYQSETLVDVLVRAKAHHYLEFKRVEGSYVLGPAAPPARQPPPSAAAIAASAASTAGRVCMLRPVPASKSDIFRDKSLGLSEKRALMSFLAAVMEAAQGAGRLKEVLSGSSPLVDVLAAEGIPHHLRQVVLHGIAMCDQAQEPQPSAGPAPKTSEQRQQQQEAGQQGPGPAIMTAKEGAAALQLLAESLSRFGGAGAFMVPSWGCGSLPEAFVRCCAVNGGTTALRCRIVAAELRRGPASSGGEVLEAVRETVGDAVHEAVRGGSEAGEVKQNAARGAQPATGEPALPGTRAAGGWLVDGVVTAGGQLLKCDQLVASPATLNAVSLAIQGQVPGRPLGHSPAQASPPGPGSWIHRALVILDGPLVKGQSALTLVIPPHSPALAGANAHAVRGLQMGPSLSVCPQNRCLLYLSTPASSSTGPAPSHEALGSAAEPMADAAQGRPPAEPSSLPPLPPPCARDALLGAVSALCRTEGLTWEGAAGSSDPGAMGSAAPLAGMGACESDAETSNVLGVTDAAGPDVDDIRPRAIEVFYYTQGLVPEPEALPSNALCCGAAQLVHGSPLGLTGYSHAAAVAESAFRLHFPGLKWLTELEMGDASGGPDDDDGDAIEDLQAALGNLELPDVHPEEPGESASV